MKSTLEKTTVEKILRSVSPCTGYLRPQCLHLTIHNTPLVYHNLYNLVFINKQAKTTFTCWYPIKNHHQIIPTFTTHYYHLYLQDNNDIRTLLLPERNPTFSSEYQIPFLLVMISSSPREWWYLQQYNSRPWWCIQWWHVSAHHVSMRRLSLSGTSTV